MATRITLSAIATTLALASTTLPAHAVTLFDTPGDMRDLDIGADADVFAIGRANVSGTNGRIYTWIKGAWYEVSGGGSGTRIAVDPQGTPWIVNSLSQVFRHTGSGWQRQPGVVRDIDIGADGSMYALGEPGWADGNVYRWNGSDWSYFGGSGNSITVDRTGHPWVTKSSGEVWRHTASGWVRLPGIQGRDIDAGADGTVYALAGGASGDKTIYRYTGTGWAYNGDSGVRIAVGPTGAPNVVRSTGIVRSNFVRRLHGYTSCPPGASDCNVCATDVRRQLRDAFDGKMSWQPQHWYLNWNGTFPPHDLDPNEPFDDGDLFISSHHVQGFVRTSSPTIPYVGSFSDDQRGSLFMLGTRSTSPFHELRSIHLASIEDDGDGSPWIEKHLSGVHALGRWVVASDLDRLRFFHTDLWDTELYIAYDLPGLGSAGGGLGIARTGSSRYLVIATLPGSNNAASGPRVNHVWQLDGNIFFGGMSVTKLSETQYLPNPAWTGDHQYSENLSVITECETGQLYTVHATGPDWISGTGYFRLSRLEENPTFGPEDPPNGHVLRGLDVYAKDQDMNSCYLRAAGTAYANDQRIIDLYCHAYDPRNDWLENAENVTFYRGVGYHSSCYNRCGGSAPSGCWCDSYCAGMGDCCTDKVSSCGS